MLSYFETSRFPPQDKSALPLFLQHLKAHGLDPKTGQVLDNLTFTLPPLEAPTLDSHIYAIGSKLADTSLSQAELFTSNALPPKPDICNVAAGWTRYSADGISSSVPYPNEQLLCLDVETMPPCHNYAIMAWAAPLVHGIAGYLPGYWTIQPALRSLFRLGRERRHKSWWGTISRTTVRG